ncbi:MAG: hypothetical protein ACO1N9_08155 [Flavobacterium sp.]
MALAQELTVPAKFLTKYDAGPQQFLGTDAFGARYSIADNEYRKQTANSLQKYKNLQLGAITRVDLQNPLQVVLFYKRFNTVVLLDNQANETRRINFNDLGKPNETMNPIVADAVGLASQNRLWLYDINTLQLGLFDITQNTFRTITPPFRDTIIYYQSDYNYFYWIDVTGKCFRANLFGKIDFLGNIPPNDAVVIASTRYVLLRSGNALTLFDMELQVQTPIAITEKTFESFTYSGEILSIFTGTQITEYKITLPQ